jgi:hypothetical protein
MESSAVVRITDHNGVKEFASPDKSKSHFVKITGLEAGKTYGYQVIAAEGAVQTAADGSFQIKTAARPGESFTFAVYGDTRPGDTKITRYHEQVIEQVKLNEPAFCLVLGDMVDDGARADLWNEFFGIESGVLRRSAIYPVFGDTDLALGKSGLYKQYFPGFRKGYYRFDWGGTQFFALQAWGTRSGQSRNEFDADSEQAKWFEREMAKEEVQKAPFRVVFLHDPVYISRGRASDLLKRIWVPLFQKYKVDAVFASWHLYERSTSGNITYIISGGAGAELIWSA